MKDSVFNNKPRKKVKGFTLIELLIVIAILAVLATAVTLILNPVELLRQGRDATRLSDLAAVHSAIALYLADRPSVSLIAITKCTSASAIASETCSTVNATSTAVDGTGWASDGSEPDFTAISSGSPLSRLPRDPQQGSSACGPSNNLVCGYGFGSATDETYELITDMESVRYSNGGGSDVESTDGGDNDNAYEIGNDPGLTIM